MKKLLIFLFAFLFLFCNKNFAQADSNKVEIDLDYLVGRIIDGFWVTGSYAKDRHRYYKAGEPEYHESSSHLAPGLTFLKKDLFGLYLSMPITYYDSPNYHPSFGISYRPLKTLHFSFTANTYLQKNRDISNPGLIKNSDSDRNRQFSFRIYYLSRGEQAGDNPLSKWFYFPEISYGTLLNSNQFYFNSNNNYYENKSKIIESNVFDKQNLPSAIEQKNNYRYARNQITSTRIAYNFRNKIILQSEFYGGNNDGNYEYRHDLSQESTNDYYIFQQLKNNSRARFLYYSLGLTSFASDRFRHHISYIKRDNQNENLYFSYIEDNSHFQSSHSSSTIESLNYTFSFLRMDQPISLEQLLSNYCGYYPVTMPCKSFYWSSGFTFFRNLHKYDAIENLENRNISNFSDQFSWNNSLVYGFTDKFNARIYFTSSYYNYHFRTRFSGSFYFIYSNYKFDPSLMSWSTLSDFDYWQKPLLRPGMKVLSVGYQPPNCVTELFVSPGNFMKIEKKSIDFDNENRILLSFKAGLQYNIEFNFSSIASLSEYVDSFDISPTFKFSLFRNTRFQIDYSYSLSKNKNVNQKSKRFHFLVSFAGLF